MPTASKPAESTTAPANSPADAPQSDAPDNVLTFDLSTLTGGDDMPSRQITRALDLERQRAELGEKITANRDMLRLLDKAGELSDDQGNWLDVFYPEKEKGTNRSKDEIEATRKAKEAARKFKPQES